MDPLGRYIQHGCYVHIPLQRLRRNQFHDGNKNDIQAAPGAFNTATLLVGNAACNNPAASIPNGSPCRRGTTTTDSS